MPIQKCLFIDLKALIAVFFLVAAVAYHPVNGLESRKLDEATGDQGIKCNPSCTQNPPPPPPPSPDLPSPPPPCPPPPALPPPPPPELPPPPPPDLPPPPPPSPPKKPPTQYCPPPPSSFINIAIPPGNLYPIDTDLNGAGKTIPSSFPVLVASVILGLLAFR